MRTAVFTCSSCNHFGGYGDFLSGDVRLECPRCGAPEESITKQIIETTSVSRKIPDIATVTMASVAIRGATNKAEISQQFLDQLQFEIEHERLPEPKTLKAIVDAIRDGQDLPSILQNLVDAFASLGMRPSALDKFVTTCGEYQPTD